MKRSWTSKLGGALGAALVCVSVGEARAQDEATAATAPPPAVVTQGPVRIVRPGAVPDTVYLRGGGMIRGSVYEMAPNDHVGLLDFNGAAKVVRWADVERVVFADPTPGALGPAAPAAVPLPATAPLAAAKPAKVGPLVRVHIQSKRGVQLYRQPATGGSGWVEACTSPCDEDMPIGDDYRIAGAGIFQSSDFRLEGAPGSQVVLNIDPGTRNGMLLGGVLAAVGGIVDYISLWVLLAGAAQSSCSSGYYSGSYQSGSCSNDGKGTTAVGLAMLAGGTAAIVGGVIIMIANGSTGVSQNESTAKTGSARPIDAYRRDPMWATASTPVAGHGSAPALSLPILSGSF